MNAYLAILAFLATFVTNALADDALLIKQIDPWATQSIALTWSAVAGAGEYTIERRNADGKWIELLKINEAKFIDTDVISGSKYAYRVQPLQANESLPPTVFEASTARFRAYDSTDFWSRLPVPGPMPGMLSLGAGGGALFTAAEGDRRGPANERATKNLTRRVVDEKVSLFIDIESWAFGVDHANPTRPNDIAKSSVEKMKQVIY